MDPLTRGVYTLLGERLPHETLARAQLHDARRHLSAAKGAVLEQARRQAATGWDTAVRTPSASSPTG